MDTVVDTQHLLAGLHVWILGEHALVQPLTGYGAHVRALDSVEALYRELPRSRCNVLIVDTVRLGEDVTRTAARFQRRKDPAMVLLVDTPTPERVAAALWAGAQACLSISCPLDLLAATVYSAGRRMLEPEAADAIEPVRDQEWSLESDGWDIRAPNGNVLALTEAERAFMTALFATPAEVVSREQLIHQLTDEPWAFDPHRIEVLVHRLRARVRQSIGEALPVRAVRGVGYRLSR